MTRALAYTPQELGARRGTQWRVRNLSERGKRGPAADTVTCHYAEPPLS
jgi:hypothetical protein